jgi:AI-2 transport protein TqsA
MKQDRAVRILLLLCASVLIFAALYFARAIIAPVAFSLFVIAIAWPLQRALQAKVPKLLALLGTIVITLAVIAVLVFLVVWGFGRVVQWVINNTDRFQALYTQATEWLDGHGVSITGMVADSYNPGWIVGAVREIGGRGYSLISFIILSFAFIVLGLLEVDVARRNIERLNNSTLRRSLLSAA